MMWLVLLESAHEVSWRPFFVHAVFVPSFRVQYLRRSVPKKAGQSARLHVRETF